MKKRYRYLVITILIIGIIGLMGINKIAPHGILRPPRINENIKPEDFELKSTQINIEVEDKINLKGYWIN